MLGSASLAMTPHQIKASAYLVRGKQGITTEGPWALCLWPFLFGMGLSGFFRHEESQKD